MTCTETQMRECILLYSVLIDGYYMPGTILSTVYEGCNSEHNRQVTCCHWAYILMQEADNI